MTNDNQDALRCAARMNCECDQCTSCLPHIFRLVRENEALRSTIAGLTLVSQSWKAENEAKDALLRQALAAIVWECGSESSFYAEKTRTTIAAIRQHLEGRA